MTLLAVLRRGARPSLALRGQSALLSSTARSAPAKRVRVRYAPSPTGYLHLGGLRTALFNYLFAKNAGGDFILRIEDTDKTRQVPGSVEALIGSLRWCGVEEDEGPNKGGPYGPYIQSQRLEIYQEHALRLLDCGHAYRCFCSSDRLANLRKAKSKNGEATMYDRACLHLSEDDVATRVARGDPHTIRLRIPEGKTVVKDLLRGYVQFDHSDIDDQVLMKSDGYPTYHLANVVDDHAMKISHVIRGEEWLPSTPKHLILYKALGFEPPQFAHLGLLLNEDRTKLSKRQGDVAVEDFRDKGFTPAGLVNFVALLGWNSAAGNNQEIFTLQELEEQFSLENVNKAGSVVNVERLRWINSRHIRDLFDGERAQSADHRERIVKEALPFITSVLATVGGVDGMPYISSSENDHILAQFGVDYVWKAMDLMKERVGTLPEFGPLCVPFVVSPDFASQDAVEMKAKHITADTPELISVASQRLDALGDDEFTSDKIMATIKAVAKERKIGMKNVLMPVRYYLTGMEVGASLGETIELLGKPTVLRRLQSGQ